MRIVFLEVWLKMNCMFNNIIDRENCGHNSTFLPWQKLSQTIFGNITGFNRQNNTSAKSQKLYGGSKHLVTIIIVLVQLDSASSANENSFKPKPTVNAKKNKGQQNELLPISLINSVLSFCQFQSSRWVFCIISRFIYIQIVVICVNNC